MNTIPGLHARLVDRWGAACEHDRTTWSRTLHPNGAAGEQSAPAEAAPSAAEDLRLVSTLGRGGMGEVWLAEQTCLEREVAVKLPHPGADPSAALRAEARLAGALEHPHIVPVHALLPLADGRPVMVMKRVQGATLQQLIDDTAHPAWSQLLARYGDRESTLLEVLIRVTDALAFAHSRGVLHRDVKPENIMVGAFGEAYLMDWGCAVPAGACAAVAGTPAFMAPEMLDSATRGLDPRSDVYLVGATLHAALTSRPRHTAQGLLALLVAAHTSAPVAYDDSVPADLAALCNRATARKPADRFDSMAALRAALGDALRLRTTLSVVHRVLSTSAPDAALPPTSDRLRRLREAHYALVPLRAEWPNQVAVTEPLQRVLEAQLHCALALGRLEDAEEALAAMTSPPNALVAALEDARAQAQAALHHAALGEAELRERDVRPSRRGLVALVAFMAVNGLILVGALSNESPAMTQVFFADLFADAVIAVGALLYWRTLTANRHGRRVTASIFLLVLGMTASDGLCALTQQLTEAAAPFSLFAGAFGFAAMATLLDVSARQRWICAACAAVLLVEAVVAAVVPSVAVSLVALSVVEMVVAAVVLVREMLRSGPRTA